MMREFAQFLSPPRGQRGPMVPTPADSWFIARMLEDHAPCSIPLKHEEIVQHLCHFRVIWEDNDLVAVVAARPLADGRLELRSLAVKEGWRGQGLARRLTNWVLEEARKRQREVVCVTVKPAFFATMGFVEVPLDSVPEKPARRDHPSPDPRFAMARKLPIA